MFVDLVHLFRTLRRSPASAAAAILTLSLTLGAGASIFAVVDAVLLTPPPFRNPDTLVILGEAPVDDPTAVRRAVSYATFVAWRDRATSLPPQRADDARWGPRLATLEASDGTNLTLTELGAAERVSGSNVTPGFLTLLGLTPALGRGFAPDDVGRRVVIISHAFWRGKLAADPAVVGRPLVLGGQPHTIVGVLPEVFLFAQERAAFWRPFPVTPAQAIRSGFRVGVVARLAGNVSAADLRVALDDVSRTNSPAAHVVATPIANAIAGDATRTLSLLGGAAALALLIAFTNLAGLLIVRSIDRRRELAVRTALGARQSEIARQLLLESATLAAIGVVGGVLLAWWVTPGVGRLALQQFGAVANRPVMVSWRVVGGLAIVGVVCAVMCGLFPAFVAVRRSVVDALRQGATAPPRERALRRLFVTGVIALGFVLLVSVMLLGRSLFSILRVNPGFDARGVIALQLALPAARYPSPDRVVSFYSTLQSALDERLGSRTVSIVDEIPLTHDRGRMLVSAGPSDGGREAVARTVAAAYFDVMRIPLIAGRSFEATDNAAAPPRVVVSESLATRLFTSEQPVGRQIRLTSTGQAAEIIGVAGDVKLRALDDPVSPTIYLSALQAPSNGNILIVRSARPDADVIAAVREEVARLDRELPVYGTRSMREVVATSPGVPARRVLTATFLGFAILAVVLGAIGLFGVVAHDVASRRAELALRMALGAEPLRILMATLGQGAVMVGLGLVVGGVLSIWAARALGALLFATGRFDALSIGAAAIVLMAAGVAAVLPAARRAARTDPLIVLRGE